MRPAWVNVSAVVHMPLYAAHDEGVRKEGYHVYYVVRDKDDDEVVHKGDRILLAQDPIELYTLFRHQMQSRWGVEPNSVIWETTAWGK